MKRGLVTCPRVHNWKGHSWVLGKGCAAQLGGLSGGPRTDSRFCLREWGRTQGVASLYLAGVTQRAAGEGGGLLLLPSVVYPNLTV